MQRTPVVSSNIRSVGFDGTRMHIEFANGRVYEYSGSKVPEHHANLMKAEKKGTYFAQHIRSCPHTQAVKLESSDA